VAEEEKFTVQISNSQCGEYEDYTVRALMLRSIVEIDLLMGNLAASVLECGSSSVD
jgi:hypothetical protein